MTNSILNLTARVEIQAERIRMALAKADLNNVDAEAATAEAGYKIPRNRIKQLREGTVQVKDVEIAVLATVCAVEEAMIRGEAYVLPDFRASSSSIPGYPPLESSDATGSADILNSGRAIPVHTADEKCFDCVEDPNAHVRPEDLVPGGGPVDGQLVIDLRDEALERFLQDNVA